MKIGVFGDSYANHKAANPNHLQWWQYVQQECPDINIETYGVAGSSMYYTWKQFHDNQHKYDKVIVCMTTSNRLWMPHLPKDWNLEHVHNLDVMKYRTSIPINVKSTMNKALKLYYKYIINVDEQKDIWRLQIADIKRTRPDGLYFSGFNPSIEISDYMPLNNISELDGNLMSTQQDHRANHFNDKNCRLFADKIVNWIQTNQFSLDITEFKIYYTDDRKRNI